MTALDLIHDFERRGIELKADGGTLRYRPVSAVTPELVEQIKTHKTELISVLSASELPVRPPDRQGFVCELTYSNRVWGWRYRRHDAAVDAYWAWKQEQASAGETMPTNTD